MFVTFEGIDGCGKTTLIEGLKDGLLKSTMIEHDPWYGAGLFNGFVITREPGGSSIGKDIRAILMGEREERLSSRAEVHLFLADREQHLSTLIVPKSKMGTLVLCDRYADSTIAYQRFGRNLNIDFVDPYCGVQPDLTFWIQVDPEEALRRMSSRKGEVTRFDAEALDFHRRVDEGYQHIAKRNPSRVHRLDGTRAPEDLVLEAWATIVNVAKARL